MVQLTVTKSSIDCVERGKTSPLFPQIKREVVMRKTAICYIMLSLLNISVLSSCSSIINGSNNSFSIEPETGNIGNSIWGMRIDNVMSSEDFTVDQLEEYNIDNNGIGTFTTRSINTAYGQAKLQYYFRDQNEEGFGRLDSINYLSLSRLFGAV